MKLLCLWIPYPSDKYRECSILSGLRHTGMTCKNNTVGLHCDSAARFRLTSRSSAIVSLVPFPFGSETQGFGPSPIIKMLVILSKISLLLRCHANVTYRVAKVRSRASFTCTMSKSPMCFSRCTMTPTRPMLRPPVIITRLPVSNLMIPVILL